MKLDVDERVHVLDAQKNVWSIIKEIASNPMQEDAFYICDIGNIVEKHKIWMDAMPRVKPFYAVKCNDALTVLEILAALGTGFDCASKGEITRVMSLGVAPERIIYANPAKQSSHVRHANSVGVDKMTFDSETELYKVKDLHPDAKMVLRIRCDDSMAQCPLGIKFGSNVSEAPHLLQVAKDLGIDVIGVSFHVGSGCKNPPTFRKAIANARGIFDIAAAMGFNFNLLDLGGGYPGDFGTSIESIAEVVNAALSDYFPDPNVNVIAEPGRFYVSSAYTLACNVHSIRTVNVRDEQTGEAERKFMYFINDGVYGSFNCILYDHQQVMGSPLEVRDGKLYHSSVWGPTCDGLDQVLEDVMLPEMKLGDWLVFENMGAYTLPVASNFNGFPIPKVHIVAMDNVWELLKKILPDFPEEVHFVMAQPLKTNEKSEEQKWEMPKFPIKIPVHCDGGKIEEHILDFVEICPMAD